MEALGLIETKGLIAAVESADAMLKAAEVTFIEKTYVGGGLVSIVITGGVAAVKAAVEAGATAVNQIDSSLLVSVHVIPRPSEELEGIIISVKPLKKEEEKISLDKNLDEINKKVVDIEVQVNGIDKAMEILKKLKVTKLRNLAREYKNMGIAGRKISKADKKNLLINFKEYYSKK